MWNGGGCCGGDNTISLTLAGTTITGNPGNSSINISTLPTLTLTSGTLNLVDASGTHPLQSIAGDLYYGGELLAKSTDLQVISEWAQYPAATTVNANNFGVVNVAALNFQAGSGHYGSINNVQNINGAIGRNLAIYSSGSTVMTANIAGVANFAQAPQTTDVPLVGADLTNKSYVDSVVAGGGAAWSTFPATHTVDISGNAITNVLSISNEPGTTLSFYADGFTAMTVDVSGMALFTYPPKTSAQPVLGIDLTNKTYVDLAIAGATGSVAGWANYSAVNNVNMAGNDIFNGGSFTAGGITKSFTLGSGPAPMLAANIYATNVDIVGYAPSGNSVNLHGNNTIDIRSDDGDINIIAATNEINITSGDINITSTDLTSVLNITSAAAVAIVASGAATMDAVGAVTINAGGAGNFAAGGALSLAGGDYIEMNTGEVQMINTTSGQSLLSVNNIQGNSHNGGDGTLTLSGFSVTGDINMYDNNNITRVNQIYAQGISAGTIRGTTFVSPINFSGGASIAAPTVGPATDLNMISTTGSVNLTSSFAIYATAPEGLDMTNCDIVGLANINGVQYIPTEQWSTRPAISDVQIAGYDISGAGIVYATEIRLPGPGNAIAEYGGCTAIKSGDALYLQPQGTVIVQDLAGGTPNEGALTAGYLQATTQVQAPTVIVNGPTDIKLSAPSSNILDITDTAGAFLQARMATLNLNSGGGDLALFKQSPTRLATTDGITDRTIAYTTDIPTASPLPAATFSSTLNQQVTAANTPTLISHNTVDYNSGGFHLDGSGNIVADISGVFEIIPSIQFNKDGGGATLGYFWFSVNGTNVPNTSTQIVIIGANAATVGTVSLILELDVGDTVGVVMASSDATWQADALVSQTTPYLRPANPSIITTIKKLETVAGGVGGGLGLGESGASVSMTQHKLTVAASTANMVASTTLGPVLGGACYAVVGQDLTLNGAYTQTGVSVQKVYTYNDGTNWYLYAQLSNCTSNATETWTINVQKSSTATLTNTIAAP